MKTLLACLSLFFISCGSYKTVKNKDLQYLKNNLEGKFIAEDMNLDSTNNNTSIQRLFEIQNSDYMIGLKVNDSKELEIHYKNALGGNQVKFFKGKFKKKYFKVFIEKKRITFPPIYWVINVNRLKIGLDQKGRLIINKHYDHSGMVLLFAAGSSYDYQYIFKQSQN
ncbi:hypothetical protein IVB69_03590 [Flavobacterium sp. J49]|uniref:hypothetical protein n=1 Tax=Flavobacterium sp. J49 TaxID=2718534 RepID=UPI0015942FCF|nr:hypothetical protein [Flavobacterium sp. J49]MBF6640553.1 hypothetical protein [Flavobacterium sp. J49]NIC01800.1 hypothetical protein [Flavobacterium sp. J49]